MDEKYVAERLNKTKTAKGYNQLPRIIGVWDDHDYGKNDGDKHFPFKNRSRKAFLDFIGEPLDTERRLQDDTPIY